MSKDSSIEAFEAEAVGYLDALYGNALRLTGSPPDAEDLVQETYVKACRFRDKFEPGTNLKAWLFRIQFNTFVNRYRRSAREHAAAEALLDDSLAGDFVGRSTLGALTDPEGQALRPFVLEEIAQAFVGLPVEYGAVVYLADVEEFSYREIAEIVGCPIGTVMSRLHRGRRALRRRLVSRAGQLREEARGGEQATAPAVSLSEYRRERSRN